MDNNTTVSTWHDTSIMMSGYRGSSCLFAETYQGNFSFVGTYLRAYFCTQYVAFFPSLELSHFSEKVPFYPLYQARQSVKHRTFSSRKITGREHVHSHRLNTQISPSQLAAVVVKYATTEKCVALFELLQNLQQFTQTHFCMNSNVQILHIAFRGTAEQC
ncbi:MAG: hypothetical protein Q4F84_03645 [Fibrobacter sp.]|nr:hypothetical protein [Fibrobacter sp.]